VINGANQNYYLRRVDGRFRHLQVNDGLGVPRVLLELKRHFRHANFTYLLTCCVVYGLVAWSEQDLLRHELLNGDLSLRLVILQFVAG
jgi:hypothetical protein